MKNMWDVDTEGMWPECLNSSFSSVSCQTHRRRREGKKHFVEYISLLTFLNVTQLNRESNYCKHSQLLSWIIPHIWAAACCFSSSLSSWMQQASFSSSSGSSLPWTSGISWSSLDPSLSFSAWSSGFSGTWETWRRQWSSYSQDKTHGFLICSTNETCEKCCSEMNHSSSCRCGSSFLKHYTIVTCCKMKDYP